MIYALKKYQYHICATFVFILLSYLLNQATQAIMAGFMIFTIGLIHGANDLQLIQKKNPKKIKKNFY